MSVTIAAGAATKREQLLKDGFCKFENVVTPEMMDELRRVTDDLLDKAAPSDLAYVRYQGSNVEVNYQDPVFAKLFAWPQTMAAIASVGYPNPKLLSGHLLSKPPQGPALYWHQDWAGWSDPSSAWLEPPQIFVMYYLTSTRRENGCLRVLPGSHLKRNPLHDILPEAHTEASYTASMDSPGFSIRPDEIDVRVTAGDILVGDARVLHSAHANQTDARRSCLTIWYFPDFERLSEPIQALFARKTPTELPHWWEGDAGKPVERLVPWYKGTKEPLQWNRVPGEHLK